MSDDIVTRLRAEGEMEPVGDGTKQWEFHPLCQEAADEIERLRALVHRWETCELVAESLCDMNDDESFCDTCREPCR